MLHLVITDITGSHANVKTNETKLNQALDFGTEAQ